MPRKLYLAAYDVREPRRLARALRVIKGFASGGQKSAYECWLTPAETAELERAMRGVLELEEDSFALIPLNPRRPITPLGVAIAPTDPAYFYFG